MLGSGGMGVVVAAVHVELGQRVALKFLLAHALENAEAATRFLREARAAVKIDSEHVARVLDVGRLETGAPYMVMEYLEGTDLSAHVRGTALPVSEAVDFVLQACSAMAVAHAAGIIHRDLKPANLFLTRRPDGSALLKVLDFGISKMSIVDAPAGLTHSHAIMGSPHYMSPEQVQSARQVDARTDVWSLGVILYELLTGSNPFPGDALGEVLTAVMTSTPSSIRSVRPEVPPGLERAVMRALEKQLDDRFANIGELSAALVDFAPSGSRVLHERVSGVMSRAGMSSRPPPPESVQAHSVSPTPLTPAVAPRESLPVSATDTNWADRARTRNRRMPFSALIAAAGFLAVLIGALLWSRLGGRGSDAPAAQVARAAATETPGSAAALVSAPPTSEPIVAPGATAVPVPVVSADVASSALAGSLTPKPRAASALAPPLPATSPPPKPAPQVAPAPAARKRSPLSIEFK